MMVKREVVLSRLDKLKEYLTYLNNAKTHSLQEYLNSPLIYGSSERFLHLAIECILDIGNHVISDMRYRKPDSNKDIFEVLYENKLIDIELKNSLCSMAGFRNILVHDYLKLDKGIVHNIINNNLQDLEKFVNIVIEYV